MAIDLAFSKVGGAWIEEEELELLVEEYTLPLDQGCSHWDDLVDESNRYFKRQYKESHERKREEEAASHKNSIAPRPVTSLFDKCAAVVATYFTPELRDCVPDDILVAIQKHMTKDRQIECLQEFKRWDENGRLLKTCPYDSFGRKHGKEFEWRPNGGGVWRTTWFQFGSRTGSHVEYFPNGRRSLKVQYLDERIHGHLKWWYENGQLAGVQAFIYGLKNGSGHVWREDGSLWRSKSYKDDLKHGFFRTFDEAGNIAKCRRYDQGRKRKPGAAQLTTSWPGIAAAPLAAAVPLVEPPLIARV